MRKQKLLVERIPGQTRVAVVSEEGLLAVYTERDDEKRLAGNIYAARVMNVVKGMDAAFVDIGLDKNAFLPLQEVPREARELSAKKLSVRPGQELLVQVTHEPGGSKGCRVSAYITIPGVYTVLMPGETGIGISRKITDSEARETLRRRAEKLMADERDMGLILRTASAEADDGELATDITRGLTLWRQLSAAAETTKAPALLYRGNALTTMLARDLVNRDTEEIICDDPGSYKEVLETVGTLNPAFGGLVRTHAGEIPLFDLYRVDDSLDKAMRRCVHLKHGGNLVIDETEAMTVIDVNTSANTGKDSLEETVFEQNREAATAIARLLRLRDIGGIIIVDFIDMTSEAHRNEIRSLLKEAVADDPNKTDVLGFTKLGLMEMTRRKTRLPMSKQLKRVCPVCDGEGMTLSNDIRAMRLIRDVWSRCHRGQTGAWTITAPECVLARIRAVTMPSYMTVHLVRGNDETVTMADTASRPSGSEATK